MSAIDQAIRAVAKPIDNPHKGDGSTPYATHKGILNLLGIDMTVYILSDGRSIIEAGDFNRFFDGLPK